jgi:hypothetical protein
MRYTWALLLILLLLAPLSLAAQKGKKSAKAQTQTLTGCVDEKSSNYVLTSDDMLKDVAVLESIGFDRTNFARFVGHKVSITGQLIASGDLPTLRVTSVDNIKNISDICAPANEK